MKNLGLSISLLFLIVGASLFNIRFLESQNIYTQNVLANYAEGVQNEMNTILVFWDTETDHLQRLVNRQIQLVSSEIELPLENIEYLFKIKPGLLQYRIIDDKGLEIYRVDRTANGIQVKDVKELQNTSARYYIQQGLNAPLNSIYLSLIDLNLEQNNIVYPLQKVVRIVKSIEINEQKFLFVFNILLNDDLAKGEQLLKTLGQRYALIDSSGRYILDSAGQAFKDQLRQDPATFFDDYPEFVKFKNSNENTWQDDRWFVQPMQIGDNLFSLTNNRPIDILGQNHFYYLVSKPMVHWSNWPVFKPLPLMVIGLLTLIIIIFYINLTKRSTQKQQLELKVAEKQRIDALLKNEYQKLKREEENKARMLSNISHELRTPLNALVGLMQIIDEKVSEEELKRFAKVMLENADRMSTLFKNMRDISESDAGEFVIENRPFNLLKLLQEPLKKSQNEARDKGLIYDLDTSGVKVHEFFGDGSRIVQIFEELISNAIKFTQSGDVSVVITFSNNQLSIYVKDTGAGISSNFEKSLFSAFQQQDMELTKTYQGIGLGLSVAKTIAKRMGGDITYQKNYPHGSEFILKVPLKTIVNKTNAGDESASIYSGRVLLIEDNMTNAMVIKNMLNKLGFTVDHAEDDQQALSLINTFSYELFVCDFHLGGYNLLDLYERFPEHIKSIPAIVLTGHASPAIITLLKEEGFEYVLYKPVNSNELAQVIQRVL